MKNQFVKNSCDGTYNSFDIHFTSACDNKCAHCIDTHYAGFGINKPDIYAIADTVANNAEGYDDVLFLGGEPALYLKELLDCVILIKANTKLKVFVTTAVPKICHDEREMFERLIDMCDGINLSVQHHDEAVADSIRRTKSEYDRQAFYNSLPHKEKIRININIVKPFLYKREDIEACLRHYDAMGFSEIKLSEIQHGEEYFVSFEDVFDIKLGSPYFSGCQKHIDTNRLFPGMKTPLLLKRSCFMCEETLKASVMDGVKVAYKALAGAVNNKYGVIYEDGTLTNGWR